MKELRDEVKETLDVDQKSIDREVTGIRVHPTLLSFEWD
jgi:hypothetical protein